MFRGFASAMLCAAAAVLPAGAHAADLIHNGGFESGNFSGWSVNVEDGSSGNFFVVPNTDGSGAPESGLTLYANPNGQNYFATTDQGGPGSYSLIQSFTLASAATVNISFDLFFDSQSDGVVGSSRDYNNDDQQNAIVDILSGSASPFTESPTDIVQLLYGPAVANASGGPQDWVTYQRTLSLAAGTYLIRFAETDNQGLFNFGVDNVSVIVPDAAAVPEPASWALMIGGFGLVGGALRRRARVAFA